LELEAKALKLQSPIVESPDQLEAEIIFEKARKRAKQTTVSSGQGDKKANLETQAYFLNDALAVFKLRILPVTT
jgi:hypothetical protein